MWGVATGTPGNPDEMWDWGGIYLRGALTLQALRVKIGDDAFFATLREWAAQHKYGNVTTAQFVALAEEQSGMQLDDFFQVWLYEPGRPAAW